MIKTLELKGLKSLRALNAFHTLMLGLKMLPAYMGETYEDFFAKVKQMTPDDQKKIIREAVLFVELQKEEVEALICFAVDANGVPFGPANLKNLGPDELHEIISEVCFQVSQIRIDLVTDAEKKN